MADKVNSSSQADQELADTIIQLFTTFEYWNPWHEFKFAETAGLNMRFFLPTVGQALRSEDWPGDRVVDSPEFEEKALQALRQRARQECGLFPKDEDHARAWQTFFPDLDFATKVKGGSKRAGEIRKFSMEEVAAAIEKIQAEFPDIPHAVEVATRHNVKRNPNFANEANPDIQVYRFTFYPTKHALLNIYPEIDSLDNSSLAGSIFHTMQDNYLVEYKY